MADPRYLISMHGTSMLVVDFRSHWYPQNCRQSIITTSVVGSFRLVGAGPEHVRGNFGNTSTVEATGKCSIITRGGLIFEEDG